MEALSSLLTKRNINLPNSVSIVNPLASVMKGEVAFLFLVGCTLGGLGLSSVTQTQNMKCISVFDSEKKILKVDDVEYWDIDQDSSIEQKVTHQ